MEGSTIFFLSRRRNRLIFKEEPGFFTQNPGGFYINFDRIFRSCNMEGSTIIFLSRRRNGLIFKEEPGHFIQNPGGFYNNFSFK